MRFAAAPDGGAPAVRRRSASWLCTGYAAILCGIAAPASAQVPQPIPDHTPLNPVITSRSPLAAYAYRVARPGWTVAFAFDYGSAVELDQAESASYVLDAELARATMSISRDLGRTNFVFLEGGVFAAHAGFADAFFDGFHDLIGYEQWARTRRPRNTFAYEVALAPPDTVRRPDVPFALGDLTIGIGRRHGAHLQSIALATLPLSTAPDGYRRGVATIALINTARVALGSRASLEATLAAAAAPRHGALDHVQRTFFMSSSAGVRIRLWREHAVYGLLFHHTPLYDDVGLPELDRAQLTVDFGVIVRAAGQDWRLGLVEETRASDGGIDLVVRLGVAPG